MTTLYKRNIIGIQSIWLPVSVLGGLLLLSLIVQLALSLLFYNRILPVDQHVNHLEQIQLFLYKVEQTLTRQLPEDERLNAVDKYELKQALQNLLEQKNNLADSTPAAIRLGQQVLDSKNARPRDILLRLLFIMRKTFQHEAAKHVMLTHALHKSALLEVKIGIIALITLPLSALIILILMRRRIYVPLQQMGLLMKSLGNQQYQRIPPERVDPMFQALFENYNNMVVRLAKLEAEHVLNEHELQLQVDKATRTLIEQQRNLSNTERLAALGEVTARMAHELRNPLAGVQMACSNLKADMAGKQQYQIYLERLTLMCSEINRMIDLLNSLLSQARHDPEPLREVNIDTTIQDLLTLARYQMPTNIKLQYQPVHNIVCRLPDIQFRQALLNLILNARQAMAEKAGNITLHVSREADTLIVRVTDDGPGFPSEILDNNIRAFSSQRSGGTGLGLSMVKRFVHNQGGEILLSNLSPSGACVTLKLPCT